MLDLIQSEFIELQSKYNSLSIERDLQSGSHKIFGTFNFLADYGEIKTEESFCLEIFISARYPNILPDVRELEGLIPDNFHVNPDKTLCLGVKTDLRLKFEVEPNLLGYVDNCVIPYLYLYGQFRETGKRPELELSHGGNGVYEYYRRRMGIPSALKIFLMLDTLLTKGYKEHLKCVCGSDKKTKNCHGDDMHLIYKSLTREELKYEKNQVFSYLEELKMAQPIKMLSALRNKADRKSSRR